MDQQRTGHLSLAVTTDADGDTLLHATGHASGFSGNSSFWWWDPDDLMRFAQELSRYPLKADTMVQFAAGYGDWVNGAFEYEYVRLEVRPVGRVGQVGIVAKLAADESVVYPSLPSSSTRHLAQVEVLTTYERLSQFSRAIVAIAKGKGHEARIDEERLD